MSDGTSDELPIARVLSRDCMPGDFVTWSTVGGDKYEGHLKEWDSNVAIVEVDGKEKAVEC